MNPKELAQKGAGRTFRLNCLLSIEAPFLAGGYEIDNELSDLLARTPLPSVCFL